MKPGDRFHYYGVVSDGRQWIEILVIREKVSGPNGSRGLGDRRTGEMYRSFRAAEAGVGAKNRRIGEGLTAGIDAKTADQ